MQPIVRCAPPLSDFAAGRSAAPKTPRKDSSLAGFLPSSATACGHALIAPDEAIGAPNIACARREAPSVTRPPSSALPAGSHARRQFRQGGAGPFASKHRQPGVRLRPAQVWPGGVVCLPPTAALIPEHTFRHTFCSLKNKAFSRAELATFGAEQEVRGPPAAALSRCCALPLCFASITALASAGARRLSTTAAPTCGRRWRPR